MTLVDTSVWVDWLSDVETPETELLARHLSGHRRW